MGNGFSGNLYPLSRYALVAQLVERLICNQDVGSSNLLGGTKEFGGLAQLGERLVCNQ